MISQSKNDSYFLGKNDLSVSILVYMDFYTIFYKLGMINIKILKLFDINNELIEDVNGRYYRMNSND